MNVISIYIEPNHTAKQVWLHLSKYRCNESRPGCGETGVDLSKLTVYQAAGEPTEK